MGDKKEKTAFERLYELNVNDKTDDKEGLTYLSWAWAWAEFKKVYPEATYNIVKSENGQPYFYDENTGYMVYTNVTADGLTHEMWLPVMDSHNRAMKSKPYTVKTKYKEIGVAAATMFDVNKAIMRCLTKNLAMFGLGLYIYAGEDLPDTDDDGEEAMKPKKKGNTEAVTEELRATLKELLMETNSDTTAFLKWCSQAFKRDIANVDVMTMSELKKAIPVVAKKKEGANG